MVKSSIRGSRERRSVYGYGRAVALAAVAGVLALVLGGCSITQKRDEARLIVDAEKNLVRNGTALMAATEQETVLAVPSGSSGQAGFGPTLRPGQSEPARTETIVTNFPLQEALVTATANGSKTPSVAFEYFHDGTIYQRLPNAGSESRPYLQLDFGSLYDSRKANAGVGYGDDLLDPLWVVELLRGPLTGSVRRVGSGLINGVFTTEYSANFDWTKSLGGTTDAHTRAVEAALTLLGVPGSAVKGAVWIDRQGSVRQMVVTIRESKGRHREVAWKYTIHIVTIGRAVNLVLPNTDQVARVDAVAPIADAASAASGGGAL